MSELREPDVRDLLDRVADGAEADALAGGEVDVDAHWAAGRRRRAGRRAGAAAIGALATVALVGALVQTGMFRGEGPVPTGLAAVPDGYTTFVLAAPEAAAVEVDTLPTEGVSVPDPAELDGTSWVLLDDLWGRATPAAQVVGADPATTTFAFGGAASRGWGFVADGCGGGWFQDDLVLSGDGRFPPGDLGTDDQGCPPAAQDAEDFWIEALSRGGYLRRLGEDWLLLSVAAPASSTSLDPPPSGSDATDPSTETGTGTGSGAEQPGQTSPAPSASAPTSASSGTSGTQEPSTVGEGSQPGDGPAFRDPGQEWVGQPWPAAGGELFIPTVRTGTHPGFDRVVLDLTGTRLATEPGWRAAYTDAPARDGSGEPIEIAGDSVLQLTVNGMGYPDPDDPVYDDGDIVLDTHTLGSVVEVIRATPFEGQLEVYIGMVGEPRPYRVFLLEDPLRLVIDVDLDD